MRKVALIFASLALIVGAFLILRLSESRKRYPYREMQVLCIPVYGQSFALGEEAVRVTDFDSLGSACGHRVLTQRLDEQFGFFDDYPVKQFVKRLLRYDKRSFELQCYGLAEEFLGLSDNDSLIVCTFPGGRGASSIVTLAPGSKPYEKMLSEIRLAARRASRRGWSFTVPAYCWLQGEDDVVWHTSPDYHADLSDWHSAFCRDVAEITGQEEPPVCICYQTNCLSLSKTYDGGLSYERPELYVPQAQWQMVAQRPDFLTSGPCYPYTCVGDRTHIDGEGQKRLGYLAGLSLYRLLQGENSDGMFPQEAVWTKDDVVEVTFVVPCPPLAADTLMVRDPGNLGFSVVAPDGEDILESVTVSDTSVYLKCRAHVDGAKVMYAANGEPLMNGNKFGSRGCLHDSQGLAFTCTIKGKTFPLDNWCPQFVTTIK